MITASSTLVQSCFLGKAPSGAHADLSGSARRRWPSREGGGGRRGLVAALAGAETQQCFPFVPQPLPFQQQEGRERSANCSPSSGAGATSAPGWVENVTFWLCVTRCVSVPFSLLLLSPWYLHSTTLKCLRARGKW